MQTNRKHAFARSAVTHAHAVLANPVDEDHAMLANPDKEDHALEMLAHDFNPGSMVPLAPPTVCCGALEIHRAERSAILAGRVLGLTRREYAVLLCLAERANRVVPRAVLLDTIWTSIDDRGSDVLEVYPWSNVVNVYVNHLRRKLGAHAGMLETIRGYGYCLRPRSARSSDREA